MSEPHDELDGAGPGTPRWVKVFGAIALVALLALAVLLLFGSGHGPGRHADDPGGHLPRSGGTHGEP